MIKKISSILFIVFVSGCSFILPRPHDPSMFNNLVEVKIAVDKLNCDDKNWADAEYKIERLKVYASLRKDPQADALGKLQEAVVKAKNSNNKSFCESVIKINKTRINVIADAWRGR
jgi:hypothetical protein